MSVSAAAARATDLVKLASGGITLTGVALMIDRERLDEPQRRPRRGRQVNDLFPWRRLR